jgi:hypothetical protein
MCGLPTVFEMSQQSNFRNRAVVEKVGVRYRPNRHGDLRDTQTQPRPGLAAGAFSLLAVIGGAATKSYRLARACARSARSS